jgi:hypothetical protein
LNCSTVESISGGRLAPFASNEQESATAAKSAIISRDPFDYERKRPGDQIMGIDRPAQLISRFGIPGPAPTASDIVAIIARSHESGDRLPATRQSLGEPAQWSKVAANQIDRLFGLPRFDQTVDWAAGIIWSA